jgi:hypothetical protein
MALTEEQIVSMMHEMADSSVPTEEKQDVIMTQVQGELKAGHLEIKRLQVERHLLFASHFRLSPNEIQKITSKVIETYAYLVNKPSPEPIDSKFLYTEASERMNQALEQKQTKDPISVEASLPVTTSLSDISLRKALFKTFLDLTELEQLLVYCVLAADYRQDIATLAVLLETPVATLASEVSTAVNILCKSVFNDNRTTENEPLLIALLSEMFKSRLPPRQYQSLNKDGNDESMLPNALDFLNAVQLMNDRRRSQINVRRIIKNEQREIDKDDLVTPKKHEFSESSPFALLLEI